MKMKNENLKKLHKKMKKSIIKIQRQNVFDFK